MQHRAKQAIEITSNILRLAPLFVWLMPLFTVEAHPGVVFASVRRIFLRLNRSKTEKLPRYSNANGKQDPLPIVPAYFLTALRHGPFAAFVPGAFLLRLVCLSGFVFQRTQRCSFNNSRNHVTMIAPSHQHKLAIDTLLA